MNFFETVIREAGLTPDTLAHSKGSCTTANMRNITVVAYTSGGTDSGAYIYKLGGEGVEYLFHYTTLLGDTAWTAEEFAANLKSALTN